MQISSQESARRWPARVVAHVVAAALAGAAYAADTADGAHAAADASPLGALHIQWEIIVAQGVGFPTDRSIEFTTTSDDASLPRLQAMARTFATLLDIDVAVSTNTPTTLASSGRAPLRIDLAPSEFREVKIASLLSQMERNFAQLP